VLQQLSILDFGILDTPVCDGLSPSNGGDVPDCIDSIDGGNDYNIMVHTLFDVYTVNEVINTLRDLR